jgi:hypothetical protein
MNSDPIDNLAQSFLIGLVICSTISDGYIMFKNYINDKETKKNVEYYSDVISAVSSVVFNKCEKNDDGTLIIETEQKETIPIIKELNNLESMKELEIETETETFITESNNVESNNVESNEIEMNKNEIEMNKNRENEIEELERKRIEDDIKKQKKREKRMKEKEEYEKMLKQKEEHERYLKEESEKNKKNKMKK